MTVAWAALAAGCASVDREGMRAQAQALQIDRTTYNAVSQDSRVQFLILHFTFADNRGSIEILTRGPVSAHYLVTEREGDTPPKIYQLVPEDRRAWHAGRSYWDGVTALNASSIGIEIVAKGFTDTPQGRIWHDYPEEQIDLVVALVRDIVTRHQIRPDRVLGHSDIAPTRKNDPGPKFPWRRLAREGLIAWPDEAMVRERLPQYEAALPPIAWFQEKLTQHGFNVPVTGVLDALTQASLAAFQMKYRPQKFDGTPDAETAALLDVITSPGGFRVQPGLW
ncbi:MAG: N-acetylmuramoyl-L-alanine amidase [Casimicrobiaceae bacterium]|nr:N-acetylmuramoyl-L-alanine amidase [Casimicrobiaceae bacterium]